MTDVADQNNYAYGIPLVELPNYRKKDVVQPNEVTVEHEGINYELLDAIMDYIKNHPQTWMQESWFKMIDLETGKVRYESQIQEVEEINSCGAAFCFAGHVALAEGFPAPPKDNYSSWERIVNPESTEYYYESVDEFATKRLGLNYDQADALFSADNSMETLEKMVKALHLAPNVDGETLYDLYAYDSVEEGLREAGFEV